MTSFCNSTAEAISKVKGEQLTQRFRDTFFPDDQALRPGSFLRMSNLAGVLKAGLLNFYEGNFSQEMVDEVNDTHTINGPSFHGQSYRVKFTFCLGLATSIFQMSVMKQHVLCFHTKVQADGGVLSRDDISSYSVHAEQPAEGLFNGKKLNFVQQQCACILDTFTFIVLLLS